MWLGGTSPANGGDYTWQSTNAAFAFPNWAESQPDSTGNKNCLIMVSGSADGKWSSANCNGQDATLPKQATLCERILTPK